MVMVIKVLVLVLVLGHSELVSGTEVVAIGVINASGSHRTALALAKFSPCYCCHCRCAALANQVVVDAW